MKDVEDETVGQIDVVVGKINTIVYKIKVTADYGFSDIYVDGERVGGAAGAVTDINAVFTTDAGQHTVTWKLRNNYSGDITGTFDGKAMTDGKFTIDTTLPFENDDGTEKTYILVLTGAQQQEPITPSTVEDNDDGMGITDILLIVLVVLIAVMAIMVALRLMRS